MTERRDLLLSMADSIEKLALGLRVLAAEADGEKEETAEPAGKNKEEKAAEPAGKNKKGKEEKEAELPKAEEKKEAAKAAEPEKKKYTMTDVRKKLASLSDAGKTAEVKAMLGRYGAAKLSLIKPEDYEAVMAEAEEMEKEVKETKKNKEDGA